MSSLWLLNHQDLDSVTFFGMSSTPRGEHAKVALKVKQWLHWNLEKHLLRFSFRTLLLLKSIPWQCKSPLFVLKPSLRHPQAWMALLLTFTYRANIFEWLQILLEKYWSNTCAPGWAPKIDSQTVSWALMVLKVLNHLRMLLVKSICFLDEGGSKSISVIRWYSDALHRLVYTAKHLQIHPYCMYSLPHPNSWWFSNSTTLFVEYLQVILPHPLNSQWNPAWDIYSNKIIFILHCQVPH